MPEAASDAPLRIYEGSSITVRGEVIAKHAELVEEVTFKFFVDGQKSEEKTVPMKDGTKDAKGNVAVTHSLRAAVVADDKEGYVLDYHVFYKVKHKDGVTETHENLAVRKFEVLPRTAQLAVTHHKDGKPIPNFQFKVFQAGQQVGGIQSTFAFETENAKGEKVPAGTAEFNLGLVPGFRIVQASPYEIVEETATTGRKRALKGDVKFRAVFVSPKGGTYKQLVNLDLADEGRTGQGREVTIGVAPEGDEDRAQKIASETTEVHFRVTYGPESGEVAKSKREDAERPTKVTGDKTATIEEKTANAKYQGKVTLGGGVGYFKVGLGVAGGDTCLVEIAGSDKFLTDTTVPPDQTLRFENWRKVYYELMVPDVMAARVLDDREQDLGGGHAKRLDGLGKSLFIEFEPSGAPQVFSAMEKAGDGTLLRASFLELPGSPDGAAYVLSGRNWRDLPDDQAWDEDHPGRTLLLAPCDGMLKWRKDTAEPQAATKDYSGTQKKVEGSLEMEATFGGLFMPFSGDDGGDGITDITWTADIAKTDACAKYTPAIEIEDVRDVEPDPGNLQVYVASADTTFAVPAAIVSFPLAGEKFDPTVNSGGTAAIQAFVDALLEDKARLVAVKATVKLQVAGPEDADKGEGACFDATKAKLNELFDATKKEFAWHPGLDAQGEPRTGEVSLADVTDAEKSTTKVWHYRLGKMQLDGTPGPGAFVGAAKSATECPIKIEVSAQPHKAEGGAAEGKRVAWVVDPTAGPKNLVRYVLAGLGGIKDKAALKHGHGTDGKAGDCLATADVPCADCIAFGRSVSLDLIP